MKTATLKTIVWKEGAQYVAQCLNVDVSSFGLSREEALANIREALELYFEDGDITMVSEVEQPTVVETSFKYV